MAVDGRPPTGRPFGFPVPAPIALTIGGTDSSGGAGVPADLATFAVHGVFGTAAIARVTAQNTIGVRAVGTIEPALVRAQLEAIFDELPVGAAKTGSLGSAGTIRTVAAVLRERFGGPLVVDPVSVAKSGAPLLDDEAQEALRRELGPLAVVLTPNLREAEALLGRPIASADAAAEAARALRAGLATDGRSGPIVVITRVPDVGRALDLVCGPRGVAELAAELIPEAPTHGAGCVFAAAITAELAGGADPEAAIRAAKRFVTEAIRRGLRWAPGRGPVNPSGVDRGERSAAGEPATSGQQVEAESHV